MTEQQFTDDYNAAEADAAEQALPVDEQDEARDAEATGPAPGEPELELPFEADAADAAEQAVPVPVDEDEYR
jgi:hypothetical protein